MEFTTINELNKYLSDNLVKLDIKAYIQKCHESLHRDLDISFMEYFLYLSEHPDEFIVEHRKLIEYGVFDSKRSNDIKKRIDSTELMENIDYKVLRNVAQNSNGGRPSNEYTLIRYHNVYIFLPRYIHISVRIYNILRINFR